MSRTERPISAKQIAAGHGPDGHQIRAIAAKYATPGRHSVMVFREPDGIVAWARREPGQPWLVTLRDRSQARRERFPAYQSRRKVADALMRLAGAA